MFSGIKLADITNNAGATKDQAARLDDDETRPCATHPAPSGIPMPSLEDVVSKPPAGEWDDQWDSSDDDCNSANQDKWWIPTDGGGFVVSLRGVRLPIT